MTIVLDADVVIGALDAEHPQHAEACERFLAWQAAGAPRVLSLATLTEILTGPAADTATLLSAREAIAALGVAVHAPNEAIAVDASRLRQAHPVSLPDAYALATARHLGGRLVSFDEAVMTAAAAEGLG